jgi:large subunit ribosomal protein L22
VSAAETAAAPAAPEFVAKHRFARITARKARRIADLIRGRPVNQALELLQFAPQRGAAFYLKVVRSAVANASLDENVNVNRLFVSECRADDGPLLNGRLRYRPGPQGRAMPFAKRLSHLMVKVRELPAEPEDEGAGRGGKKKASARKASGEKASGRGATTQKARKAKKEGTATA